jgi:cytochrome c-type biogenesis protein
MEISFAMALLAGVISFLSPCVLPLVPTYLLYLGGDQGRPVVNSLFFILGFSLVFVLLGLPFTLLGAWLASYQDTLAKVGGVLVVLFGLFMLGLRPRFLAGQMRASFQGNTNRPWGAFLLGITFAAGWTPCIGPILGGILTITAAQANMGGIGLLLTYALGLAVPFFIVALFADQATEWIRKSTRYTAWVERSAGALMVVVGLMLVTGTFSNMNQFFLQLTPAWLLERL